MAQPGNHPADSENWCVPPPPLADALQSTGSTMFASANSCLVPGPMGTTPSSPTEPQNGTDPMSVPLPQSEVATGSPTPSTLSQSQPFSGLVACVVARADGTPYLIHKTTGMRINIIDDSSVMTPEDLAALQSRRTQSPSDRDGTLSDTSDLPETMSGDVTTSGNPVPNLEQLLAGFLSELDPQMLSPDNPAMLNVVYGYMATSRDRLLATTGIMVDQQTDSKVLHQKLMHVRNEVSVRLAELHEDLSSPHDQVHDMVQTNIQSLHEIGVAENFIGQLLRESAPKQVGIKPSLLVFGLGPPAQPDEDLTSEINSVLPPRTAHENSADFAKVAEATLNHKDLAVNGFALNKGYFQPQSHPNVPPQNRTDAGVDPRTRFMDTSSISAPNGTNYGYVTPTKSASVESASVFQGGISQHAYLSAAASDSVAIDAMEQFTAETDTQIATLISQQVGDLLDLPSRIKPPKLDQPGKYTGGNDHGKLISWVERLVTWMRAMQYSGPEASVANFWVTMLRMFLDGPVLDWYLEYIENISSNPTKLKSTS
ncbi:hypothetical protein C8J57DRAFT_1222609 [Mycena rebaudengoi]|nr:hypothetical protein C8J57DRAFT_1222609 [Mycena rebaudengoi]